jgi:predicted signal transduction protein with EAL and GGDEF domain
VPLRSFSRLEALADGVRRWLDRSHGAAADLAQNDNVTITAEGIERKGQLDWLRRRGCHEAQGFLLSMPLSAHDLEQRFLRGAQQAPEPAQAFLESVAGSSRVRR